MTAPATGADGVLVQKPSTETRHDERDRNTHPEQKPKNTAHPASPALLALRLAYALTDAAA